MTRKANSEYPNQNIGGNQTNEQSGYKKKIAKIQSKTKEKLEQTTRARTQIESEIMCWGRCSISC